MTGEVDHDRMAKQALAAQTGVHEDLAALCEEMNLED